jgi:RNA polymerase sigma-70 factor (ECF subfamily)
MIVGTRHESSIAGVDARFQSGVRSGVVSRWLSRFDDTLSDGELARAVIDGAGRGAESSLVSRFGRRVYLYGMRHLRDEARAEDLAQDVMTVVIERLRAGEIREPDRVGSFILGTARWMAHDIRRRERRAAEVASAASREVSLFVEAVEPREVERLSEALEELSERERAIVVLSFRDERSAQEIGEAFGLRAGHVRVIRHRAIARLATLMGVGELEDETEAP